MSKQQKQANEAGALRLWYSLLRTIASLRAETRAVFARWELTGAQYGVLRVIGEAGPEGLTLGQIGERLAFTPGNTTGLVDRLEEAGHVRRFPHPEDRRAMLVASTDKGQALYQEVLPAFRRRVTELFACLSEEQRATLVSLLAEIEAHVSQPPGPHAGS